MAQYGTLTMASRHALLALFELHAVVSRIRLYDFLYGDRSLQPPTAIPGPYYMSGILMSLYQHHPSTRINHFTCYNLNRVHPHRDIPVTVDLRKVEPVRGGNRQVHTMTYLSSRRISRNCTMRTAYEPSRAL